MVDLDKAWGQVNNCHPMYHSRNAPWNVMLHFVQRQRRGSQASGQVSHLHGSPLQKVNCLCTAPLSFNGMPPGDKWPLQQIGGIITAASVFYSNMVLYSKGIPKLIHRIHQYLSFIDSTDATITFSTWRHLWSNSEISTGTKCICKSFDGGGVEAYNHVTAYLNCGGCHFVTGHNSSCRFKT